MTYISFEDILNFGYLNMLMMEEYQTNYVDVKTTALFTENVKVGFT